MMPSKRQARKRLRINVATFLSYGTYRIRNSRSIFRATREDASSEATISEMMKLCYMFYRNKEHRLRIKVRLAQQWVVEILRESGTKACGVRGAVCGSGCVCMGGRWRCTISKERESARAESDGWSCWRRLADRSGGMAGGFGRRLLWHSGVYVCVCADLDEVSLLERSDLLAVDPLRAIHNVLEGPRVEGGSAASAHSLPWPQKAELRLE